MWDLPPLSKRESQIMDIPCARGEVMAEMPDALSRAAVRTFPRILKDKGHLTHRREGRHFIFKPVRARKQVGRSTPRRALDVFFSGSLEAAVAAYLTEHQDDLNSDELEKMAALIRRARKEGR